MDYRTHYMKASYWKKRSPTNPLQRDPHAESRVGAMTTSRTLPLTTPFYHHLVAKNFLLILLSFITLPLSGSLVFLSLVWATLQPQPKPLPLHSGDDGQKTILVTGVSMTKGLTIARLLSQHTPHRVIGADTSPVSPGRFSCALSAFHKLAPPDGDEAGPYIDSLLHVIKTERVDLWISCSSVIAAVEDGQVVKLAEQAMGTEFTAVQFREDVIAKLHEKDKFIEYVRSLDLLVPESHRCTSTTEVLDILLPPTYTAPDNTRRTKWIMKPIGVDDKARNSMMTLLPFTSPQKTRQYIKDLQVSPSNPFQLQQFIQGEEYCTHALIIRGHVTAFVACPSSELLMHYEALSANSHLSREMLAFTQRVARDGGETFTGHLSFDFLVEGEGKEMKLYPIECNPRAHTAVVLFSDTPHMAGAYLSAFSHTSTLADRPIVVPTAPTSRYYWVGHDLLTLLVLPLLDLLWGRSTSEDVQQNAVDFGEHLMAWKDGTFTVHDPMPFFVLYHVYWPLRFLYSVVTGRAWSR
jgi:catechol O-methyltransferase